jgi:hypothetical protein
MKVSNDLKNILLYYSTIKQVEIFDVALFFQARVK